MAERGQRCQKCCACNGPNAVCKAFSCARKGPKCFSCHPKARGTCRNIIQATSPNLVPSPSQCSLCVDCPLPSLLTVDCPSPTLLTSAMSQAHSGTWLSVSDMDQYMLRVYGNIPCRTTVPDTSENEWIWRWSAIAHLAAGNYSSERLMVFSVVILQCNRMVRKGADIREVMEKRMEKWTNEEYDVLVDEAVICDKSLKTKAHKGDNDHFVTVFTRLMLQGKTTAAIRWQSEQSKGLVLPSSKVIDIKNQDGSLSSRTVLDALKLKHPAPQCPPESVLIKHDTLPPRMDLTVTGAHIHFAASRIQGGAGPSGTDAGHWQNVLLRYRAHSDCLRDSVATLVYHLANDIVPWDDIRALMACRLIALDKCPGIRPIGIGEKLRKIIGKSVTRYDLNDTCDITQLCGGVRCGIEVAIHAVSDLFRNNVEDEWGVLMIDALNAFNSINRQAALWNTRILWPSCSLFMFNTYRGWAPLVVTDSSEYLYSREGVTQGDSLSMFVYAVATLPLIESIGRPIVGRDVWYADDASACAPLDDLKTWFTKLLYIGPLYGYYPESKNSVLVVSSEHLKHAHELFASHGVKVTTSHRLLGGVIGDQSGSVDYVKECVSGWISNYD